MGACVQTRSQRRPCSPAPAAGGGGTAGNPAGGRGGTGGEDTAGAAGISSGTGPAGIPGSHKLHTGRFDGRGHDSTARACGSSRAAGACGNGSGSTSGACRSGSAAGACCNGSATQRVVGGLPDSRQGPALAAALCIAEDYAQCSAIIQPRLIVWPCCVPLAEEAEAVQQSRKLAQKLRATVEAVTQAYQIERQARQLQQSQQRIKENLQEDEATRGDRTRRTQRQAAAAAAAAEAALDQRESQAARRCTPAGVWRCVYAGLAGRGCTRGLAAMRWPGQAPPAKWHCSALAHCPRSSFLSSCPAAGAKLKPD